MCGKPICRQGATCARAPSVHSVLRGMRVGLRCVAWFRQWLRQWLRQSLNVGVCCAAGFRPARVGTRGKQTRRNHGPWDGSLGVLPVAGRHLGPARPTPPVTPRLGPPGLLLASSWVLKKESRGPQRARKGNPKTVCYTPGGMRSVPRLPWWPTQRARPVSVARAATQYINVTCTQTDLAPTRIISPRCPVKAAWCAWSRTYGRRGISGTLTAVCSSVGGAVLE